MTDFNIMRIKNEAATQIARFSDTKLASLCEGLAMPEEANIFITDEMGTEATRDICSAYASGTFIPASYFDNLDYHEQLYALAQSMYVISVTDEATKLFLLASSYKGGLSQCLGVLGMLGGTYWNDDRVGIVATTVCLFGAFCSLRTQIAEHKIEQMSFATDEHALKVTGNIDVAISATVKEATICKDDVSTQWRLLHLKNLKDKHPELSVPVTGIA